MRYLPKSDSERREMLTACGLDSADELFARIPANARMQRPLNIAPGVSEYEIVDYFKSLAAKNAGVMDKYAINPQYRLGAALSPFSWWNWPESHTTGAWRPWP